jgi:selenocysteine lyase/cysteine desulfurase
MELKKMTFMQACRDYFGLLPGQAAMDFMKEMKALTDQDRQEIANMLNGQGYEILATASAKVPA